MSHLGTPATADETESTVGDTAPWDSGLQITLEPPEDYEPSDEAAGGVEFDEAITVEITVINGTGEPFGTIFVLLDAKFSGSPGE